MADTQRSLSAILALLADNTSGDISPQDVRDTVISLRNRIAGISVAAAAAAAVTISDTTTYFEITAPTWTLDANGDADFDQSDGNGRLTYLGAADVRARINATLSFTSAANDQVLHFRVMKNGTTVAATEVQVKAGTGTYQITIPLVALLVLATGDNISLSVRNETSAANITVKVAALHVITGIK